jgi:ABC-type branched-subunit amino acid transport system substrate-binding protein
MPRIDIRPGVDRPLPAQKRTPGVGSFAQPRRWPRRHWLATSLLTGGMVLVLVSAVLAVWRPWQKCGRGMASVGSPYQCIGLNLDWSPFQANDQLADLERMIADDNAKITDPYVTVVLLENMTPDSAEDTDDVESLRHDVEGALTGVRTANQSSTIAGSNSTKVKLLLANPGSSIAGTNWFRAVDAIKRSAREAHIVAVTGIGVSMNQTREAVAALGADPDLSILTVGSLVTADNMNRDLGGHLMPNFARVAPTNTDEVRAAGGYLSGYLRKHHPGGKVLLVRDVNKTDNYATTLADSFASLGVAALTKEYASPAIRLVGTTREQVVGGKFSAWSGEICQLQPDVIYFAGRGVDITTFMSVLVDQHCATLKKREPLLITGDDANNLAGHKPTYSDFVGKVVYTGLAAPGQWANHDCPDRLSYYNDFVEAFIGNRFSKDELTDGNAMMNYDAMLVAIAAARHTTAAWDNPSLVPSSLPKNDYAVDGASGKILIDKNGNPANKPMPILEIGSQGKLTPLEVIWPEGRPDDC